VMEALEEPILKGIVSAVLVAGILIHYGRMVSIYSELEWSWGKWIHIAIPPEP